MKIYRGQKREYTHILASAARESCYENCKIIVHQIVEKKKYRALFRDYKTRLAKIERDIYHDCDDGVVEKTFYSFLHLMIRLAKNPFIKILSNTACFNNDGRIVRQIEDIANDRMDSGQRRLWLNDPGDEQWDLCIQHCLELTNAIYTDKENVLHNGNTVQCIMSDIGMYQHLNHLYKGRPGISQPPLPTMTLDWTFSKEIAEKFAENNGRVFSIDVDKYIDLVKKESGQFNALVKSQITPELIAEESKKRGQAPDSNHTLEEIFGLATYRGIKDGKILEDNNKHNNHNLRNVLMKEQQGIVIFWPWTYSIDEMLQNRKFDFCVG